MKISRKTRQLLLWTVLLFIAGYGWYNDTCRGQSQNPSARQQTSGKHKADATSQNICGARLDISFPAKDKLIRFAREKGVRYPLAFANTVGHIRKYHRLPDCYLTKSSARKKGWTPGKSLWRYAPATAIGGDRFGNREGRLPRRFNGRYREADIDYDGHKRGAHRLIYANTSAGETPVWLTVDHYRHFYRTPQ